MNMLASKSSEIERTLDQAFLTFSEGRTEPPGGWHYSEAFHSSQGAGLRKVMKLVGGAEPVFNEAGARRLAMAGWIGDPLSDQALIGMRRDGRDVHAMMDQFINQGITAIENPPEALREIWRQVSVDPDWLDRDRVERGARVYRRFGVLGHQFQGVGSIDSYRVLSIARTLMATGQYADDTTYKRFLLTCNFWTQVSEPQGLVPFGEGWKVALRIRLLHTLIRRAVFGSQRWDREAFGLPINQPGLLAPPIISSVMLCKSLRIFGFSQTDAEVEDALHMWRHISYLMGYDPKAYFPTTIKDAVQCMHDLLLFNPPSTDPDCIRLGKSFLDGFMPPKDLKGGERIARWWEHKTTIVQTGFFVTPETRKMIGAPNPWGWALIYLLTHFPKHRLEDALSRHNEAFAQRLDARVRAKRSQWLKQRMKEMSLDYRPKSKY